MKNATLLAISFCGIVTLSACGGGSIGKPAAPAVTLSANSLSFPDEAPGSVSPPQVLSLRNSGTAPLQIAGITIGANFQEIDDCVSPLAVGAQCNINVTFVPTATGNFQDTVTLTDNAPGSPHTVSLSGNGVIFGPPPQPALTGYCFGLTTVGYQCALVKDTRSCPVGKVAVQPVYTTVTCHYPGLQHLDASTSCQGKTNTGFTVRGECTVAP